MKARHRINQAIGGSPVRNATRTSVALTCLALLLLGCAPEPDQPAPGERSLRVTASAYNATPGQTNENPTLTAWGDTLTPGMRAIAVSRDLIPLGLDYGTPVRIEGLDGEWVVRDKMAKRWKKKIDIFMGDDVAAARTWGKRELTIYWKTE